MGRQVPKRADWRVADGVRVEELDGSWLALDPSGGVVYRLEARAAEVMRLVAHRLPLPGHLVPAARDLAGHGVLEHPLVDRRTAMVGAGVVTLTGLAATLLPSAAAAASSIYLSPSSGPWPVSGGTISTQDLAPHDYYVHVFLADGTLNVTDGAAITDLSILLVGGGGGGGRAEQSAGGGGGAGGVLEVTSATTSATLANGTYSVTVGQGGPGRIDSTGFGTRGGNTVLSGGAVNLTVLGGGGGGATSADSAIQDGGSGGGGGSTSGSGNLAAGLAATTGRSATITGTPTFFGWPGGYGQNGDNGSQRRAGGGGGATGPGTSGLYGTNASDGTPGHGGASISKPLYAVPGVDGAFAGGGGGAGGQGSAEPAAGRSGGATAGKGGHGAARGGSAAANSGSGGGGSSNNFNGGDGGSGIVLVRYRLK